MTPFYQEVVDHLFIGGILLVSGFISSFALVSYRQHVYESWDIIIASSFFTWLFLENWVLRKDFYRNNAVESRENQKYDELKYIHLVGELTMQNSILASANETLICELTKFKDMKTSILYWRMMADKACVAVDIQTLSNIHKKKRKEYRIKRSLSLV